MKLRFLQPALFLWALLLSAAVLTPSTAFADRFDEEAEEREREPEREEEAREREDEELDEEEREWREWRAFIESIDPIEFFEERAPSAAEFILYLKDAEPERYEEALFEAREFIGYYYELKQDFGKKFADQELEFRNLEVEIELLLLRADGTDRSNRENTYDALEDRIRVVLEKEIELERARIQRIRQNLRELEQELQDRDAEFEDIVVDRMEHFAWELRLYQEEDDEDFEDDDDQD